MMLSLEQKDGLQEYMNIFTGQAASMLYEMVNQKVELSITELELLYLDDKKEQEQKVRSLPSMLQGHIVSSSIRFGHDFSGRAHLIFPLETTKLLVRLCLEEDYEEMPDVPGELTDTDFDAVREIGNVILNAITGGMGNLLNVSLEYELPEVKILSGFDLENENENSCSQANGKYILVFYNTFSILDHSMEGAIVVVLSMESIAMLLQKIDEVLMEVEE